MSLMSIVLRKLYTKHDLNRTQDKKVVYITLWLPRYVTDAYCPNKNKTNDLIHNLTPENVTQHSRIVTTTRKGSSTPTKMSKIIGRQIHLNVKNRQNQYIEC